MTLHVASVKKWLASIAGVMKKSFKCAGEERVFEAGAGIAFFEFFSIFPMLLLFIALGGFVMSNEAIQSQVLEFAFSFFPVVSHDIIRQNLERVLENRSGVGVVSIVGLLWASTSAFAMLSRNLSRAWPDIPVRNVIKARLVAVGMTAGLLVLILLFSFLQAMTDIVIEQLRVVRTNELLIRYASHTVLYAFLFGVLLLLYRFVPHAHINWRQSSGGALFALLVSQILTAGFGWYLSSGVNRYNMVYGSLGALVAFLFWLYAITTIILLGAHICAHIKPEPD
ncbi:MAG: YihY family inner membrane protein [Chitinivibrionales bacterium]|nr:YihY family inner membrane protein [Chitinivibrionales bacterium]